MAKKDLVCPRCLESFPVPLLRSPRGGLEPMPVQRRSAWQRFGEGRWGGQPAPGPSSPARAAASDAVDAVPVCPNGHRLPPDYAARPTVVVGVVGLTGASKSTFLTVLIDALHAGALAPLGISVELDEYSADRFERHYHQPLLVDHRQLPLTPPLLEEGESPEPLTLVLRRTTQGGPERAMNLVLFDASGEQLYRKEDLGRFSKFLYEASAVLVVLSPGMFPRLQAVADPGEGALGMARPTQMLVNLADLLRSSRGLRPDGFLQGVSTGVVLSKADKLLARPDFPADTLRNPEISLGGLPRLFEDVRDNSARLVDFLEANGGSNLLTTLLTRLPDPTVHAVSATGSEASEGAYPSISPVGCLEPLLVLLARHGLLPSEGLDDDASPRAAGDRLGR
ncbi:hypothetical protein O2W15_20660 [Modestobacter sp. VKM Ac-2979]|uniref:TRAFAC clade GTPase domain-containing protein n=1 Tax=unclassified Modestobacter TaxID=2643866 RepID=UPI0022AB8F37|nr:MULTISPECIES: hypothetical protein [unclassified Modestobacter]MCZ2813851.1 hypothetical protein [Modestobacter sp. VKM Ac-2979]MCZ2844174.1 hypothetical protein [Modestobacter sp. VKM Ac-2980]